MYVLKGLYLEAKVKFNEKAIRKITKEREKLKAKQLSYTKKYEEYLEKLSEHKKQ